MGRSKKESNDWMEDAVKNPGYLHKALKIKQDRDIPISRIDKATHSSNQKIAKAANLAKTFAKYRPQ
jgi:hypothetical protein